jgi:hypothetical protein
MRMIFPPRTSRLKIPPGRSGRRWPFAWTATARASATAGFSAGRLRGVNALWIFQMFAAQFADENGGKRADSG